MCFSANASFATAGLLAVISALSVRAARKHKKLIPLAVSPLIFALQQACEGVVWITFMRGDTTSFLHLAGMQGFLFFASSWWPIWIPSALYYAESIRARKQALSLLTGVGCCTAVLMFISWPLYVTGVEVINHHLNYPVAHYPLSTVATWCLAILYCIATVIPLFISSIPYIKIIGITVGTGLIISYVFYLAAFPSVWCFFAAVSSICTYFVIKKVINK